jgi:hypothetical protein
MCLNFRGDLKMKKILITTSIVCSLALAPLGLAQSATPPQTFNFVTVHVKCAPHFKLLKPMKVQITVPGASMQPVTQRVTCGEKRVVGF